jgi:hypothetical protein
MEAPSYREATALGHRIITLNGYFLELECNAAGQYTKDIFDLRRASQEVESRQVRINWFYAFALVPVIAGAVAVNWTWGQPIYRFEMSTFVVWFAGTAVFAAFKAVPRFEVLRIRQTNGEMMIDIREDKKNRRVFVAFAKLVRERIADGSMS